MCGVGQHFGSHGVLQEFQQLHPVNIAATAIKEAMLIKAFI